MTNPDTQYGLFDGIPPHQDGATSTQAAYGIVEHVNRLQEMVIDALKSRGDFGATDEELMEDTGLGGSTLRPRRRELQLRGILVDSGSVRKTRSGRRAIVWALGEGEK